VRRAALLQRDPCPFFRYKTVFDVILSEARNLNQSGRLARSGSGVAAWVRSFVAALLRMTPKL
jgi:hypothetical protein